MGDNGGTASVFYPLVANDLVWQLMVIHYHELALAYKGFLSIFMKALSFKFLGFYVFKSFPTAILSSEETLAKRFKHVKKYIHMA
jgi:hypothetical protein